MSRYQKMKTSIAWNHFVDLGQKIAECNVCKIHLSFRTCVSNLTKHLRRKHPFLNLVKRNHILRSPDDQDSSPSSYPETLEQIEVEQEAEDFNLDHSYTEVVYLEDEDPIQRNREIKPKPKPRSKSDVKPVIVEYRPPPKGPTDAQETKTEDGIDLFGKYVTNLLRDFPKDACIKVQGDIISLIIQEKLKITSNPQQPAAQNGGNMFGNVILTVAKENLVSVPTDADFTQNGTTTE